MKLDYFSLLSPDPITFIDIGSVKCPTLREISELSIHMYNTYINYLLMDIETYYKTVCDYGDSYFERLSEQEKEIIVNVKKEYDTYSETEKANIPFYNIIIFDKNMTDMYNHIFNFFFVEHVVFDSSNKCFYLYKQSQNSDNISKPNGVIHGNNFSAIVDIILQRINIKKENAEFDNVKVKNSIAAKLLEKMKKAEKVKKKSSDKKLELGNIISAISSHSRSINILNIWNLTVFQLYDQFTRIGLEDSYIINSTSVSVWGDKENKFKGDLWLQTINEN